jgi:hypothetical protein
MMGRLLAGGFGRAVMILGVTFFAVYGIVALVMARTGNTGNEAVTAGVMGYMFIGAVVVLWVLDRRRRTQPGPVAVEFLVRSSAVAEMIGAPVKVVIPRAPEAGRGAGQVTVDCFITGPDGSGEATVVLARLGRGYQALGADIDVAGVRKSVAA